MAKLISGVAVVLMVVAMAALVAIIYGLFFMFLWNYVAGLYWAQAPQITLLQAIATMALIGCLTGLAKVLASKK